MGRPLQSLKVAMPFRMLLVGKNVEIIVTGEHMHEVDNSARHLLQVLGEEQITVRMMPDGFSFEDLETAKKGG